ncbi:MAG: hypothetical protein IJ935_14450 [Afipia sp.]|nr:hypothetical protein [Afipia sp.]
MLHSGATAGVRTRASAIDDNAQSAATAVTVRIKFLAPDDFGVMDGRVRQRHVRLMCKEAAKTSMFCDKRHARFIAAGGNNEAQMWPVTR